MKPEECAWETDVLAFGAHADDLELACGGTLAKLVRRGYRVVMVALTAGELGTRGTIEERAQEFAAAAGILGVAAHEILALPDGGLAPTPEQKIVVVEVIRRYRPGFVLAPYWKDRHPDHANAGKLVTEAAFLAGLRRFRPEGPAWRPLRVLYYPCRYEFRPSFVVDVSETHELKLEAIRAYRSQFSEPGRHSAEPPTNISHPGFLEAVVTRGRQYGSYIGVEYGEPFLVREPMAVDDPVALLSRASYRLAFL
ncbi:MAG: bacillithiol biosynthesis deacetylase BshB1 [Acidobacteriota bacterium]